MSQDDPSAATVNLVDKLWPNVPNLIESGEAVELMVGSPGFQAVKRMIDAEKAKIDERLEGTKTLEHADYARLSGRRGALSLFEESAGAIVARARKRHAEAQRDIDAAGESAAER